MVGASGAGKSSILRAGLAYRAINGLIPGVSEAVVISPGHQPLRALYQVPAATDLIIVDQFEEILGNQGAERHDVFAAFWTCPRGGPG